MQVWSTQLYKQTLPLGQIPFKNTFVELAMSIYLDHNIEHLDKKGRKTHFD